MTPPVSGALPTFVVIGAMKCGTTSVHHYIGLHPDAFVSEPKELDFFSRDANFARGLDWYRGFFPTELPVRGESSPNYMKRGMFPHTAPRLAAAIPDAKLICVLRHPLDRLVSHYVHSVGTTRERRPLDAVLASPEPATRYLLEPGLYNFQLEPWFDHFDPDQIWIGTTEELTRDPATTVASVLAFLGLDAAGLGPIERLSLNAGEANVALRPALERLRDLPALGRAVTALPRSWTRAPVRRPQLGAEQREQLVALYRPDTAALEARLGRSFGWEWD